MLRVGFVGCGNMGLALLKGLKVNNDTYKKKHGKHKNGLPFSPLVYEPAEQNQKQAKALGAKLTKNLNEIFQNAEVILLCVKPDILPQVLSEISSVPDFEKHAGEKIFASIAAGIPIEQIIKNLSKPLHIGNSATNHVNIQVARIMPNSPAVVGKAISAIAFSPNTSEIMRKKVIDIFNSVGAVIGMQEKDFDVVTGLSGSGPAYVYTFIDALAEGAVHMGLPKDKAIILAAHTVQGAIETFIQSGESLADLRDKVTSPGGTTIAGLTALERNNFTSSCIEAVKAATERSRELGQNKF